MKQKQRKERVGEKKGRRGKGNREKKCVVEGAKDEQNLRGTKMSKLRGGEGASK